ncbi:hypothetical protein SAMN04489761_3012 [Tenacibaculum sp. MAR_2009_124]|uniref:hypothetical protein n=1 Tax=Tenacibaculum sp. MAR_2009_124 TaxID=1250059 RepID=UPI0008995ED2|nr:hypothetical protein [Tenacibaculum sp. MAR_2009_124]SEC44542.1 hypothetical protein SAMN04489761_3012 [Tenacibaculum sp. MAR_2009_124]
MSNKIKGVILGIVSFLIVTMSLLHIFFPPKSNDAIDHKKTYKKIIQKRDNGNIKLIEGFNEEIKTIQNRDSIVKLAMKLSVDYKNHYENSRTELRQYTKKKAQINIDHSFRGRSSFRLWVFMFGIVILGLFFACKSLYHDITIGSTFRMHFISFSGIFVSLFWLIHLIFLTHKDFDRSNYFMLILICALLSAIFTYFFVKYYSYKDAIIKNLLKFILRVKTIHVHELGVKSLFAERVGVKISDEEKKVDDLLDEFDSDLKETIKDL